MTKRTRRVTNLRRDVTPFTSAETDEIANEIAKDSESTTLKQSIEFSPTALTHVRQVLTQGGLVFFDSHVLKDSIPYEVCESTKAEMKCYIDRNDIVALAESMRITRAEIAADAALNEKKPKLMVIGSAPAALGRVLARRQKEPLTDVCVLTAVGGYASTVALKEKLREAGIAYIMVRGKLGSSALTAKLFSAVAEHVLQS